jgi:hypothetical protein
MMARVVLLLLVAGAPSTAATLQVEAGGDVQAALNTAQPGDEVVLAAGVRFVGEFRLPPKPAGPAITIRSSATLPDRRITPDDAALLPILAAGVVAPALVGTKAANWRIDGVQFESTSNGEGEIIVLQDSSHITLDRILIVAGPNGQKRGIRGNGQRITLTRSHVANIWRAGQESQAFAAWDGAGPYTLADNYLEAASINALFGGANSQSADHVPSDILVEGNHFSKRLEWKGKRRVVKNLFELKSAKRVVIRNNLFERNWTDAQSGWAIVFTTRNDEGQSPWSVVEDVLFERNVIRDTEGVFNILGYDRDKPSGRTTRVTLRNNLAIGDGTFLQAGSEVGILTLDHNTVDQGWNFATLYLGDVWVAGTSSMRPAQFAVESLTITNTIGNHNAYGVFGENAGIGTPALQKLTRAHTWTHNVLAGDQARGAAYPAVTWRPTTAEHEAQFDAGYRLTSGSTYRKAGADGLDVGVVFDGTPMPTDGARPADDPATALRAPRSLRTAILRSVRRLRGPLEHELAAGEPDHRTGMFTGVKPRSR